MTTLLHPTSELVGIGWLKLAAPGVGVGSHLPAADDAMRQFGWIRASVGGGTPNRDVPLRSPVIVAECWVPPAIGSHLPPWNQAGELAEQVLEATFDRSLQAVAVDLSSIGNYSQARVWTVVAQGEPRRVDGDPNNWARHELDLALNWTAI